MNKIGLQILSAVLVLQLSVLFAAAHCEIPCGIYDDQTRIKMIAEHIETIEKSMKEILSLQKEQTKNYNQLVRWIMNKDNHANKLQEIVTQYFMTQRIKPNDKVYAEKLILLHKMLVSAMQCKQTVDLSHVKTLRGLLNDFSGLYFER